jgi:hypothetical protein
MEILRQYNTTFLYGFQLAGPLLHETEPVNLFL